MLELFDSDARIIRDYAWLEQNFGKLVPMELVVKVKPETPGGLDVPYQDQLVMNQPAEGGEGGKVERLLPPPEAPKPPQAVEGSRSRLRKSWS